MATTSQASYADRRAEDDPRMRRTAVTLLLTALLMTTGLLVATPASACSCVGGTT